MTSRAQGLLRDALTLPIEERATVAAELLASLDDDVVEDAAGKPRKSSFRGYRCQSAQPARYRVMAT